MLPARTGRLHQLFVDRASPMSPRGGTLLYRTPDGRTVNITRRGTTGTAADFIALSSTCPHLGCQVRWEGQNNRYFCPCHNGTFDTDGQGHGRTARRRRPVAAALRADGREGAALHLRAGRAAVDRRRRRRRRGDEPDRPGHDPCLTCLQRGARRRRGGARERRARLDRRTRAGLDRGHRGDVERAGAATT